MGYSVQIVDFYFTWQKNEEIKILIYHKFKKYPISARRYTEPTESFYRHKNETWT